MAEIIPRDLLFDVGGVALERYGALSRRTTIPARGGEEFKETFARASTGWFADADGLLRKAAAAVPRCDFRDIDGDGDLELCYLHEMARTNVVLHNRDLTNAAWVKTNMTAAKDQTGSDGVANSASSILATAGNATVLQAITLASSARYQSAYVKRITGSGTIEMTMDNGATWTAITVTGAWTRVTIPTQTLANPTVGFRIVTSGDKIAVDFAQNENGTFATSPIDTTTVAVTREADQMTLPLAVGPMALSVYLDCVSIGIGYGSDSHRLWQISNAAGGTPTMLLINNATSNGRVYGQHHNGSASVTSVGRTSSVGQRCEYLVTLAADGAVQITDAYAGGSPAAQAASAANALASTWSSPPLLHVGGLGATAGSLAIRRLLGVRGVRTMAEVRAVP